MSAPDPVVARRRQRVLALFEAGMKPKQILEPVRADFGDHVSLAVVYNDIKWLRAEGAVAKPDGREASTGGSDALGSRDQGPILARRRERVRALFDEGMKPRQIVEQVRREFGANLRITLVYRDITWLRANGMIDKSDGAGLARQCLALKRAGKSYGAIAGELGISRSAVSGKIHRLQRAKTARSRDAAAPRKEPPGASKAPPRPWQAKRRRADRDPQPICSAPVSKHNSYPPGAPASVMTAKPGTCRWPIGEPRAADFRFCGAKALEGCSWCADCAARAWPDTTAGGGGAS